MLPDLGIPVSRYPQALLRTVFIIVSIHYAAFTYLSWAALLRPLLWVAPRLYWWVEGWLFNLQHVIVASWIYTCGHKGWLVWWL